MVPSWDRVPEEMRNPICQWYCDYLSQKKATLIAKRIFDIIFSVVLIIMLAVPMLIIAVMIKKDSEGPVLYRQERVTQYGRVFKIFKFRTMVQDADKIGAHVTALGDSRITKVGEKLRKSRLDEFPQLFNVLLGDMSFVGVRPEAVRYVEAYTDEMKATLLLPAGVTSMTSILYKDESELLDGVENPDEVYVNRILPEKMKYNLEYIKNVSLLYDIKTLIQTLKRVL